MTTEIAPVLTCGRCQQTAFRVFPGPTGNCLRCVKCAQRADTAMCNCGHHYRAHTANGCQPADGCDCTLRGGR